MRFSPVPISGYGVVSAAGLNASELWNNSFTGTSSINDQGLGYLSKFAFEQLAARTPQALSLSRASILSYEAYRQMLVSAGLESVDNETGLIFATTTGQIDRWGKALSSPASAPASPEELKATLELQMLGSLVMDFSRELNLRGPKMLVSPACSAATQALGLAAMWIRSGQVKRCIVGACEILTDLTVEGFRSLRLLSTEVCKPFDVNRTGINLSEAAAFLLLEDDTANPKGFISGAGMSSDAYHMTAPLPEGQGLYRAMQMALQSSGLEASEIDWIHAHGTGSNANDTAEGAAIAKIFGSLNTPVSSTKAIHGHSLGACGALETILCLESLKCQTILQSARLEQQDSRIPIHIARENIRKPMKHILKNTLGFGGNNSSLIISGSL